MEPKTVLFVDDEERILKSIRRITFNKDFQSLFAGSGEEALRILETTMDNVVVLVTDMRMPEMSGLELLKTCKEQYPHIVRIVLSGYSQISTFVSAINQGEIFRYILKPWDNDEELLQTVYEAFEHFEKQKAVTAPTK